MWLGKTVADVPEETCRSESYHRRIFKKTQTEG